MKLKEIVLEAKKAPKGGYDIGDGMAITQVGYDANGNWSYWVTKGGSRAKKIQTTNLEGGSGKITNVHDFKNTSKADIKRAIKLVKDYASSYMKFK